MAITVRVPTPLRKYTQGKDEVSVEGSNLRELLQNLESNYKGIGQRIMDDKGGVRRFVNIYLNDEDIRFKSNLDTPLKEGDVISIIPAIAGGAAKKGNIIKKKVYLTYKKTMLNRPIIWEACRKFNVVINIGTASVSGDLGLVGVELDGTRNEVESLIKWFTKKHVKVEPIEQTVLE
jgi:sulfur-carrier protein